MPALSCRASTLPPFKPEDSSYYVSNNVTWPAATDPYTVAPETANHSFSTAEGNRFLRRLLKRSIVFFSLIGVAVCLHWFVLCPQNPDVFVTSGSVSSFHLTAGNTNHFTADFEISISTKNPNQKMSLELDRVSAVVFIGRDIISETDFPQFQLGIKGSHILTWRFSVKDMIVSRESAAGIAANRTTSQNVRFGLNFFAWIKFRHELWRTKPYPMMLKCPILGLVFDNPTASSGYLSNWRWCIFSI